MISNFRLQKGKKIYLNIKDYNIEGVYLVKTASHTIDSKKEVVNITVEYVKEPIS